MDEAQMKVAEAIKSAIGSLEAIASELPSQAKAALNILTTLVKKGSFDRGDVSEAISQISVLEEAGKRHSKADISLLKDVVLKLASLLGNIPDNVQKAFGKCPECGELDSHTPECKIGKREAARAAQASDAQKPNPDDEEDMENKAPDTKKDTPKSICKKCGMDGGEHKSDCKEVTEAFPFDQMTQTSQTLQSPQFPQPAPAQQSQQPQQLQQPQQIEDAVWDNAYIDALPDEAFAFIEQGGQKDGEGKTTPRTLRHFPIKDKDGKLDPAHVRNALARAAQSPFGAQALPKIKEAAAALNIGQAGPPQPQQAPMQSPAPVSMQPPPAQMAAAPPFQPKPPMPMQPPMPPKPQPLPFQPNPNPNPPNKDPQNQEDECSECGMKGGLHAMGCSKKKPVAKEDNFPGESFTEPVTLIESNGTGDSEGGYQWRVQLIKSGLSKSGKRYGPDVLRSAIKLFEGVRCFADHPRRTDKEQLPERSIRDIVGWFTNVQENSTGLEATLHVLKSEGWFAEKLKEAWDRGKRDLIQLSILGGGKQSMVREGDHIVYNVDAIDMIASVDAVTTGAAGGEMIRLMASEREEEMKTVKELLEGMSAEEILAARPDLKSDSTPSDELVSRLVAIEESQKILACNTILESKLTGIRLPEPVKNRIRKNFSGVFDVTKLEEAINDDLEVYSKIPPDEPFSVPLARIGMNETEKYKKALDGMFLGESVDGVEPFYSLNEAYCRITGKSPFVVQSHPEMVVAESFGFHSSNFNLREALTLSSWAQLLGDSITRKMLAEYQNPNYNIWQQIVSDIVPIKDFRTYRRGRLGGYAALAGVAEAGPYVAFSNSPGDEEATYSVSKKGNLDSITMEMIANDDIGAIKKIPERMGRSAIIGLFKAVFNTLQTNGAVTYTGTDNLFSAAHVNLGSSALTDTTLTVAKIAMADQAHYDESENVLGIKPKFLVVPNELEQRALAYANNDMRVLSYDTSPEYALTDTNPHKGLSVITLPYWTDANNWYLIADPKTIPTIEVGFYQNRRQPEMFTQDMANIGTMFTNDQVTYKIRFIWGICVLDHRGMYGAIVAP